MKFLITIISFIFLTLSVHSQIEKLNIGLQINPIINYNSVKVSDKSLGKMLPFHIGKQVGLEISYNINSKHSIVPFLKYYSKTQKIEQSQFFGYLTSDSKTFMKYTFESVDVGLLSKYKPISKLELLIGLDYSIISNNRQNWGYHFEADTLNGKHMSGLGFLFTPNKIGTKINMFNILIGVRRIFKIHKVGQFEYGLLMYLPTKKMPTYTYDQYIETDNNGTILTTINYQSKQYLMETTLIYHLANYNRKLKRVHPKRL